MGLNDQCHVWIRFWKRVQRRMARAIHCLKNLLGVPYCKKRSCKHCVKLSEVLELTLYINGYLLNWSAVMGKIVHG